MKQYADNIEYQGTVPNYSQLSSIPCLSVQEVVQDLYNELGDVIEDSNLTTLNNCIVLPVDRTIKSLIQFLLDRDCAQQVQIDALIAQNLTQSTQITNLQNQTCP